MSTVPFVAVLRRDAPSFLHPQVEEVMASHAIWGLASFTWG
jgi:hypothetical protein